MSFKRFALSAPFAPSPCPRNPRRSVRTDARGGRLIVVASVVSHREARWWSRNVGARRDVFGSYAARLCGAALASIRETCIAAKGFPVRASWQEVRSGSDNARHSAATFHFAVVLRLREFAAADLHAGRAPNRSFNCAATNKPERYRGRAGPRPLEAILPRQSPLFRAVPGPTQSDRRRPERHIRGAQRCRFHLHGGL